MDFDRGDASVILSLGQILASIAAATLDSTPVALRVIGGASVGERIAPALWGDLGVQLDINPLFLRYGFGVGAVDFLDLDTREMAEGQSEPEPEAFHNSIAGGIQHYWKSGWMAAGAGWGWTIVDTIRTSPESRNIYHDADGKTTLLDRSAEWVWKERVRKDGPFGVLELGFGLREIGIGIQFEFGESNVLGFNFQYRFL